MHLLEKGVPKEMVQRIYGHSRADMTDRYCEYQTKQMKVALEMVTHNRIAKLYSPSSVALQSTAPKPHSSQQNIVPNFGKVFVSFAPPMSLRNMMDSYLETNVLDGTPEPDTKNFDEMNVNPNAATITCHY